MKYTRKYLSIFDSVELQQWQREESTKSSDGDNCKISRGTSHTQEQAIQPRKTYVTNDTLMLEC